MLEAAGVRRTRAEVVRRAGQRDPAGVVPAGRAGGPQRPAGRDGQLVRCRGGVAARHAGPTGSTSVVALRARAPTCGPGSEDGSADLGTGPGRASRCRSSRSTWTGSRATIRRATSTATGIGCETLRGRAPQHARIPAERFRGELLLVAGGDDKVWPSVGVRGGDRAASRRPLRPGHVMVAAAGHRAVLPGEEPKTAGQGMARGGTEEADRELGAQRLARGHCDCSRELTRLASIPRFGGFWKDWRMGLFSRRSSQDADNVALAAARARLSLRRRGPDPLPAHHEEDALRGQVRDGPHRPRAQAGQGPGRRHPPRPVRAAGHRHPGRPPARAPTWPSGPAPSRPPANCTRRPHWWSARPA